MKVIKRNGSIEDFNLDKVLHAVSGAYSAQGLQVSNEILTKLRYEFEKEATGPIGVEEIQDRVESILMDLAPYKVVKAFILYREQHRQAGFCDF